MREIRLYGSEGGGAVRSPYPYQGPRQTHRVRAFHKRNASVHRIRTANQANYPRRVQLMLKFVF